MPALLEFKPNRDLSFHPNRDLGFNPRRDLGFDSGRDLTVQPGRDLGFGKRGPVFRGYVCPVCNAAGTAEQPTGPPPSPRPPPPPPRPCAPTPPRRSGSTSTIASTAARVCPPRTRSAGI